MAANLPRLSMRYRWTGQRLYSFHTDLDLQVHPALRVGRKKPRQTRCWVCANAAALRHDFIGESWRNLNHSSPYTAGNTQKQEERFAHNFARINGI